MNLLQYTKTRT